MSWSRRNKEYMRGDDKDGLRFFEYKSQQETADIMKCSRQNVQQIEKSAMRKLRKAFKEEYKYLYL